jgi:hypothetical protein
MTTAPPIDVYVCTYGEKPVLHIAANTGAVTPVSGGGSTTALAVDPHGNVYEGDVYGASPGVTKLPVGGGPPVVLTAGFAAFGVAADADGNVYAAGFRPGTGAAGGEAIKIPAAGGPPSVVWTGTNSAWDIAVDGFQNVYILLLHPVRVVKVPAGGGAHTVYDFAGLLTGTFGNDFVSCFAVDPYGRSLYLDQSRTTDDVILKVPMNGDPATTLGSELSGVQGIAVDASENVYVCDAFNDRVVMIAVGSQPQVTICEAKTPVPIAIKPTRVHAWRPPDLVGRLFGAAAADGSGWLVVNGHFIPIPPRSPALATMLKAAARYINAAVENPELAGQMRNMCSTT